MKTIVFGLSLLTAPLSSSADPSGAQAEVLFRQARALLADGKTEEACRAFDAAQKLETTIGTTLNQANCREKNGQFATAWGLYLQVERETRMRTDDASTSQHQLAAQRAKVLESRLSTLTVVVSPEAQVRGLEILRENTVVDSAAWNQTLPVDGGTYRITARAPGNAEWSTTITVANDRDSKRVEIPKLTAANLGPERPDSPGLPAEPARAELDAQAVAHEVVPAEGTEVEPSRRSTLPLWLGGGAIVSLSTALLLDIHSSSTYDRAVSELDVDRQTSLWHSANTQRYAAAGFAIAGVATAGIAVALYVRDRRRSSAAVAIAPLITNGPGLVITGGFQ